MTKPKAVKERIHRKLRVARRRGGTKPVKGHLMLGKVVPKISDGRRPSTEDVEKAVRQILTEDAASFVENLDEALVQPVLGVVSRLLTMQLGGWRVGEGALIHEGGQRVTNGRLTAQGGKLVDKDGKVFFFCNSEKLHAISESLKETCKLLDDERKFDLFKGLQEARDG